MRTPRGYKFSNILGRIYGPDVFNVLLSVSKCIVFVMHMYFLYLGLFYTVIKVMLLYMFGRFHALSLRSGSHKGVLEYVPRLGLHLCQFALCMTQK